MSEELIRKIRYWLQAGIDVLDALNKELDERTPDKPPYHISIDINRVTDALARLQEEARDALTEDTAPAPIEREPEYGDAKLSRQKPEPRLLYPVGEEG